MYSYGSPHTAAQKQDDQHERTFSSYVRIQVVVLKTYLGRWTIGRSGERGSGISVLPARYDDDDIEREREREREKEGVKRERKELRKKKRYRIKAFLQNVYSIFIVNNKFYLIQENLNWKWKYTKSILYL